MASTKLYPPTRRDTPTSSPLPTLLQTPSGLAILELQGTINLPRDSKGEPLSGFQLGSVEFPDYVPGEEGTDWMNRVHLFIGQHQRLHGQVKKLPKAMAVVRRRENRAKEGSGGTHGEEGENLEVVEIVKYKLVFSQRPEPVGTAHAPA
ncbi:unnamed protein product [Clonostachys rhizophaga]|uniref:Chromosome transmission fidelity protein 8 n=1 Tax=Clonostachys rhizophaga TaxID=160324 RepID=A0A9N9VEY3_9HYPO|nr:unnamed protein product [Clonostachys rhizophaga]